MKKFYSYCVGKTLFIVLLSFICVGKLWADTNISGDVSGTWTKANSPYVLTGSVMVPSGKTLTIEAGVVVQFPAQRYTGYSLTVDGSLIAKGNVSDSIIFKGDLNALNSGGSPYYTQAICGPININTTSPNSSVLQYVVVDALGYGSYYRTDNTAAIDVSSSSCGISNSAFRNILGTSVLLENSSDSAISNNSFTNNTVALKFRNTSPLVSLNTFSTNSRFDIITPLDNLDQLQGNTALNIGLTADISVSKNDVMTNNNPNYTLLEAITINSGKILTIQDGITFTFPSVRYGGLSLTINGTLIAKGTSTSFITFQGDGNALDNGGSPYYTQAVSGPIYIGTASLNSVFQYVVVDALGFGSYYRNDSTAAIDISSSSCSVSHCYIQNIRGTGILYEKYISKSVTANFFLNDNVALKFQNLCSKVDSNSFSRIGYLDIITPPDNLSNMQNNEPLAIGTGLTNNITISENDTLFNKNPFYKLLTDITVPANKTLTMQPGIVCSIPTSRYSGTTLNINGTLIAKGTSTSYITFQGNGDALDNGGSPYYTQAVCGPIYINSSSLNSILQYVVIDALGFGSYYRIDSTSALVISSSSCNILNCNIQNIRGTGIKINNASPYIAGSCFNDNTGAIYANRSKAKIFHTNFVGNSSFGLKNISTTDTVDATNCWWNSPLGPTNASTNPVGGDIVSDYVLYTPWAIQPFDCSDSSILPLTLLNFRTTLLSNIVNCTWQTTNETNTDYFIVQRSKDGINFTNLTRIYVAGNSSTTRNYNFTDHSPNGGINYYRLQMVDKNGKLTYSKTIPVNITVTSPFAIYPNPAKDNLFIQLHPDRAEETVIQILDMQGKAVEQKSVSLSAGTTTLSMPTSSLAKGSYFIVVKGQSTQKKMFVKQ